MLSLTPLSDFYQIQGVPTGPDRELLGGIARLSSVVQREIDSGNHFIVVFGGDLFGPSAMSTYGFWLLLLTDEDFWVLQSKWLKVSTYFPSLFLSLVIMSLTSTLHNGFPNMLRGLDFASSQFGLFKTPWLLANFRETSNSSKTINGTSPTKIVTTSLGTLDLDQRLKVISRSQDCVYRPFIRLQRLHQT